MRFSNRLASFVCIVSAAGILAGCKGDNKQATPTTASDRATIELKNFAFVPSDPRFQAGKAIELDLRSLDIEHTFTVPDLNINWTVGGGRTRKETFIFARSGKFKLLCAVPGHEGAGMVGTVTVVD